MGLSLDIKIGGSLWSAASNPRRSKASRAQALIEQILPTDDMPFGGL
jgi:hypothetical protein